MRSEMFMTSFILCSTSTTVRPGEVPDQTHRRICFFGTHAGRGLVQEEQDRLGGEGNGDLEMTLLPVRKVSGQHGRLVGEAYELEDGQRPLTHLGEPVGS